MSNTTIATKRRQNFDVPGNLHVGGILTGVTPDQVGAIAGDGSVVKIIEDLIANRPAAGTKGLYFYATDESKLYRDTGTTWELKGTMDHADLANIGTNTHAQIDSHIADITSNPHQVQHDQTNPLGADTASTDITANKHVSNAQAKKWEDHANAQGNPHNIQASQIAITDAGANFTATDIEGALAEEADARQAHEANTSNPHAVTTEQINALNLNGGTMLGSLILAADPTQSLEAATKNYVDSVSQGLDVKKSVRVATTTSEANIDIDQAPLTIDGVTLSVGDRVLVKNGAYSSGAGETSTNASSIRNGIYEVTSLLDTDADSNNDAVTLVRTTDANEDTEVTAGMFTFVEEGTVNQDSGFVLVTDDPVTIGTSPQEFSQFSGAGQVIAGTGLYKNGNEIGITNSGVTDTLIGPRTVDDTFIPTTNTDSLTNLINGLAHMFKQTTGEADWKTNPATTLKNASIHINDINNPHGVTTSQIGAATQADFDAHIATPAAPTNLNLIEYADYIEISFDLPVDRSNVSHYEIWASVGDESDYNLIDVIQDADIDGVTTSIAVKDDSYDRKTTIYYKVYSSHNGIKSTALAGSITSNQDVPDPTNLQVVSELHTFKIEYDLPKDRRLEKVRIKVDANADDTLLSETNATVVYEGLSDNFTYQIPDANLDLFHQFWVESVTKI